MLASPDMFDYRPALDPIEPWRPRILTVFQWRKSNGPDYAGVYAWRIKQLKAIADSTINRATGRPFLLDGLLEYYRTRPAEFIQDWMDTYDPRKKVMKWMPFVFFQRQGEFIDFLNGCFEDSENGLVEKCRDFGLTWLCVCWSVWAWLFVPGVAIGWGSRKEEYVDKRGDPDSIFEKIRLAVNRLPKEFLPKGFDSKSCMTDKRVVNPVIGSTIMGEIGDNIGRGGRKSIYFKDESAHYVHPDVVESALGDNTNVQIDISSVNGIGNVFYNKRHSEYAVDWAPGLKIAPGMTRIFVADWRDHPNKTDAWYQQRKARWIADGLFAKFAQEVDRDYASSVEGTIIPLEWIVAATDAHVALAHWKDSKGKPIDWITGAWMGGLDVADSEEGDRNALAIRKGIICVDVEEWGERDIGATTRRAIVKLLSTCGRGVVCQYDSVGMGSSVKSEYNRLTIDEKSLNANQCEMIGWNAGASVDDPYDHMIEDDDTSPTHIDFFENRKAQAWWNVKLRFYRTWQAVTQGIHHDPSSLIILDSHMMLIRQLQKELAQPIMVQSTKSLKQMVDKKPKGKKSPNLADAVVMAYFPVDTSGGTIATATHGISALAA